MGLRDLKKEQTRRLIGEAAWRLFADRGFDAVTVAEVAREAQVAPATVFNYFSTKEDLFYWRLEAFGTRLLSAVSGRPAGASALDAFRVAVTSSDGLLELASAGDAAAAARLRMVNRLIASSPALLAREQVALNQTAGELGVLLAADIGAPADDVAANGAANALLGVHRALIDFARRRVLAADDLTGLALEVRSRAEAAFDLLARGLSDYAVRA
jgi:AcrR family transcriptional regulator